MNLQAELGSGPLDAPLLFVGRDYGSEEARLRQPFQGLAGQVLNVTLRFAGLRREEVRIDNLVPKQPPNNDWDRHDPADIVWGAERLRQLIAVQRPKLIVGLGGEVAKFLLGDGMPDAGIQELRGYFWDTAYGRVLTTVHPAGVLQDWTPWRALLNLDVRRAAAELRAGCPPLDTRSVSIVTDPRELEELYGAIRNAGRVDAGRGAAAAAERCRPGRSQHKATRVSEGRDGRGLPAEPIQVPVRGVYRGADGRGVAFDIENTADFQLACLGVAPSAERAWVIPAYEGWQLAAIRALCESDTPKVLQNGQYDRFFLRRFCGIELRRQVFDTQLAWHTLQPELAGKKLQTTARRKTYSRTTVKSLRFLASIYTRDPFWKDYAFQSEEERYILCGKDCCVTLDIATKQAKQLEEA